MQTRRAQVPISAHHGWNFDELSEKIWEYCNIIRVYTKPKGAIPDYDEPGKFGDKLLSLRLLSFALLCLIVTLI